MTGERIWMLPQSDRWNGSSRLRVEGTYVNLKGDITLGEPKCPVT